ncbi:DUF2079 domain-containing protein [candidate division KSB1 bacterium]|nr:DUF2079 domain-containing protein [candidate division KSB1 bacterium]
MPQLENNLFNSIPSQKQFRQGLLIVSVLALCYIVGLSYLSILRFRSFNGNAFDLGLMIQAIWNTSHGRILVESINIGSPSPRVWTAHLEFIYLFVALIYKIFRHADVILVTQTFVLGMGAYAVYLLAVDRLKNVWVAVGFAACYLLFPAMQNANLCDVHGLVYSTSLLIFAFYFFQKKSFKLFGLFAILALMCREDISLILFMFGLYAILILKDRKVGIALLLIGMVYFGAFYERAAIRSLMGLPEFVYHEGGESHWSHLSAVKENPIYLVTFLAKKYNIKYLTNLFGPLSFLSILSPTTLVLMAPTFLINILSSWMFTHDIEHIYTSTLTPIIFISSIYGFGNAIRLINKRRPAVIQKFGLQRAMYAFAGWLVLLSLFFFVKESNVFDVARYEITVHHKKIDKAIATIEPDASVSADLFIASRTTEREQAFVFPDNMNTADYVLYDFYAPQFHLYTKEDFYVEHHLPVNKYIQQVLENPDYGVSYYDEGITLFKKGMDRTEGLRILSHTESGDIEHATEVPLVDSLKLMGYTTPEIVDLWFPKKDSYDIYYRRLIRTNLFWESTGTPQSTVLFFHYRIDNGTDSYIVSAEPVFGIYPPSQWPDGALVRDLQLFEIPYDSKPGTYTLSVYAGEKLQAELNQNDYIKLFDFQIKGK